MINSWFRLHPVNDSERYCSEVYKQVDASLDNKSLYWKHVSQVKRCSQYVQINQFLDQLFTIFENFSTWWPKQPLTWRPYNLYHLWQKKCYCAQDPNVISMFFMGLRNNLDLWLRGGGRQMTKKTRREIVVKLFAILLKNLILWSQNWL